MGRGKRLKGMGMRKAALLVLGTAGIFLAACGKTGNGAETADTSYESEVAPETEEVQPELPVSEEEKDLYAGLYRALEAGDMEGAAALLNENETEFRLLADQRENGVPWLFSGRKTESGREIWEMTPLGSSEEETGLVLTRFNTAFFGTFRNGKPEGECLAVQAVVLEEPRFTYASGQWKDGAMNGPGVTGYRYYGDVPEGKFAFVSKEGIYAEDLCDGELVYEAGDGQGDVLSWKIQTSEGVTVLDDRWLYYAYSREYMLPSEQDEDRVYVIGEDMLDAVRWSNLIQWETAGEETAESLMKEEAEEEAESLTEEETESLTEGAEGA